MKISTNNVEKLQQAINSVQTERMSQRLIDAADIAAAVQQIEAFLEPRLYRKDWTGLRYSVDFHAQTFPGAYKGVPESTQFTLERCPSGWFVTEVCRRRCQGPRRAYHCHNMADKAAALVDKAEDAINF